MMQSLIDKVKHAAQSYQGHLFLSILTCCLIPLGFMGYISIRFVYQNTAETTLQAAIRFDNQLYDQIENRIEQVENTASAMQYNLYNIENTDSFADELTVLDDVRSNISMYMHTFDLLHISVYLPSTDKASQEGLYYFPIEAISNYTFTDSIGKHHGTDSIWFLQENVQLPMILNAANGNAIGCARVNINQYETAPHSGFIILLQPWEISNMIRTIYDGTEITGYLITGDGQVLAHSDPELEGTNIEATELSFLMEHVGGNKVLSGNTYYRIQQLSNGWYQVAVIPQSYVMSSLGQLRISLMVIFCMSIVCILAATILLSRTLTRRLASLAEAINHYQLGNKIPDDIRARLVRPTGDLRSDEFDQLGSAFLTMSDSVNESMNSVLELTVAEKRLRYQLLQSQINPHFLYNILGTIRTCNSLGRPDTANQMIDNLTRFYRLTLHKSEDMIPIRDEVEIAQLYLQLERLCHSNNLTWEFRLDDGIENYYMCKFTLQPFLENCIHYGYSETIDSIHITVEFTYGDDTVIVTVQDNGVGIQADRLAELREMLEHHSVNTSRHFGIGSVAKRISSPFYGNGYVEIDNVDNGGAIVTITFAQMEEYIEIEE